MHRAAAALVAGSLAAAAALLALADVRGGSVGAVDLLLPWYEVASDGDGLGPESVNMWKVPPTVAYVHPNTFQDPTKWNGDHVLNGGNKEWAEEDAALHAYNMENWRNKILSTQVVRQKQQYNLMNVGGPRGAAGGPAQSLRMQSPSSGGMVGTMSTAMAPDEPAKTTDGARGGSRRSRRSSDGADAELVKIERGNQRLLRRILRRLRRKRAAGRGDGGRGYRRSYMRRLERRNQRNLDAISQRLADLTQETTQARHGHPGRV